MGDLSVIPRAFPDGGVKGVSTATSLIVLSAAQPTGLALLANGQSVPLSPPILLGRGIWMTAGAAFWRVGVATSDGMLIGGAEHVLSRTQSNGTTLEMARFTTAAAYDKAPGVAPVLRTVRLWRVRYPVDDINSNSGNCVSAEYHGFIVIDYDPGTVPNTPPAATIQTFHLVPENGGSEQTFVYAGDEPFIGHGPAEPYPMPWYWAPELDPTRRYCLTISAFGDGDLARPPLESGRLCADVVQQSARGAPAPPVIGGGGTSGSITAGGGGGCAVAGAGSSAFAVWLVLVAFTLGARRPRR